MELRKKTLLAVAFSIGCTLLAVSLITFLFIDATEKTIEREQVLGALDTASYAIAKDGDSLLANLRDYAAWNETYAYLQGRDPSYYEINMRKEIFSLYAIDAVVWLRPDNSYYAGGQRDPPTGENGPVDPPIVTAIGDLAAREDLIGKGNGSTLMIDLNGRPALVISHPVLTDQFLGPPAGTMHFVRIITPDSMNRVSRMTGHEVSLRMEQEIRQDPATGPLLPLSPGQAAVVIAAKGDKDLGVLRLPQQDGGSPLYLTVTESRDLYLRTSASVMLFISLLLIGGAGMTAGIVFFVDRTAFSRVNEIIGSLRSRQAVAQPDSDTTPEDGDELAELAALIDPMVHDLVESQRQLRESEVSYRGLFNTIRQAVFIHDADGKILDVNDGAIAMYGYTREEFLTKTPDFLAAPGRNNMAAVGEKIRKAFSGEPQVLEFWGRRKNGEIFPKDVWLYRGTYFGKAILLAIASDITERKRADEALAAAYQKLNLMSSITRHDVLNQLMVFQGYLALLREMSTDGERSQHIGRLESAARTIEHLITFTRDYQDLGIRAPAWFNVGDVAREAASHLIRPEIRFLITTGPLEIFADPLLIKVFYNLIENSLQHGGTVRAITISAERRNGVLALIYEDDGAGVPLSEKERIFRRGVGSHTGLGLFLATQILAITGITIRETGEPGKGVRFEMLVPDGMFRNSAGAS